MCHGRGHWRRCAGRGERLVQRRHRNRNGRCGADGQWHHVQVGVRQGRYELPQPDQGEGEQCDQ